MPDLPNSLVDNVVRAIPIATITNVDQTTEWISCQGKEWISFYCSYERGAAGGIVQFFVEYRLAGLTATFPCQQSALAVGAVAAGADTLSTIQRDNMQYGATAAGAEGWIHGPIILGGSVRDFRITYRETGVPGTPGDFGIDVQMGDRV